MKRFVILLIIIAHSCTDDNDNQNNHSMLNKSVHYQVYAAVIDSMYLWEDIGLIVISDSTECTWAKDTLNYDFGELFPEIDKVCISNLYLNNDRRYAVQDSFNLSADVKLITDTELHEIFNDPHRNGWDEFYKRYPHSQGIMELSRAGVNADSSQALVYVGNQWHWLAGAGWMVQLEKRDNKWKLVKTEMLWISK